MAYRNNADSFGSVAKSLHWIIALLILLAYVLVYAAHLFTVERTPEFRFLIRHHAIIGMVTLALVALRLWWRLRSDQPQVIGTSRVEHIAAALAHWLLYALMLLTPLTGWLGFKGPVHFWHLFAIPAVKSSWLYTMIVTNGLGWTWEEYEPVMDWLHKDVIGGWLLWLLVAVHVVAALYHHFMRRDRTLLRMLPESRTKPGSMDPD